MLVILPIASFCLWVAGFRRSGFGWRNSFVFASIPCSLLCVYSTECLSIFHSLTRLGVSISWLLCAGLAAAWLVLQVKTYSRTDIVQALAANVCGELSPGSGLDAWDRAALYFAAGLAIVVGLTALVSAPNTADAMAYHLPRVVEWIGNRGVQNYPTVDRQQLTMPPLAEYAMLHLDLLYGTDRLVNLVQWFAYIGCIVGVSLVTEEFGGDRRTQAFAAVLAATVPTVVLGGSGAKNDNVLAYWIVLTIYFLVAWKRRQSLWLALAIGASGSLAAFTKGTTYTFMPCLILACWMMWERRARRRFMLWLPVFVLLLLSVCGPLWMRNYRMTGSVFGLPYFDGAGSIAGRMYANSPMSPAQAVAGVARNASLNLSVPSEKVNAITTEVFYGFLRAIGVNPNDAGQLTRNQNGTMRPFQVVWVYRDEILSANQWNFLLFMIGCVLYVANWRKRNKDIGWLALGLIGAFTMYSALLRWAAWNGRYHLPLFTLSTVFVALVLARFWPRSAIRWTMVAVLLLAVPMALMNDMRPWISRRGWEFSLLRIPRYKTYFLDERERFAESFLAAANAPEVKGCRSIGLDATLMRFEYPMMALIDDGNPGHRFQYLSVENPTVAYADAAAPPACVVVCLRCAGSAEKLRKYGANPVVKTFGEIVVFSNRGSAALSSEPAGPDMR